MPSPRAIGTRCTSGPKTGTQVAAKRARIIQNARVRSALASVQPWGFSPPATRRAGTASPSGPRPADSGSRRMMVATRFNTMKMATPKMT